MGLILRWLLTSVALLVTIHLVPGVRFAGEPVWVLAAAAALGLLNMLARPALFLVHALTFPLACLTFGLWTFVLSLFVNILVFYFVGTLGWGFRVDGFLAAALGALVMSALNVVLSAVAGAAGRAPRR